MNGSSTQKQAILDAGFFQSSADAVFSPILFDGKLIIEAFPDGRKQKVIARSTKETFAVDSFNLSENTRRAKFTEQLKDHFDDDQRAVIAQELRALAEKWQSPPTTKKSESSANANKKFDVREDGVYALTESSETFLCSKLEIVGATRNQDGEEWGRLLRFSDADNHLHTWAMPMSLLSGDGNEYRARLLNQGLILSPNRNAKELLTNYIQSFSTEKRIRCVSRVGWHGENYILPNETFSPTDDAEEVLFQSVNDGDHRFRSEGTLQDWQTQIARYCVGNSRLVFAVSSAFASVLLTPLGEHSGGFHLRGASSLGKTTALYVAGSVFGGNERNGYLDSWHSTINGLESASENHNDGLLCLDELGQADKKSVAEIVYMIANETGKGRMQRNTFGRRKSLSWKLLYLSSGELTLTDICAESGQRTRAGQDVRLVDLEADAGRGSGLFENTHGFSHPSEFSNYLRQSSLKFYGAAIREFLRFIVQPLNAAQQWNDFRTEFQKSLPSGASGEVVRVANRFALVAFAGEIASDITLWKKGEALDAAIVMFKSWLANRTIGQSDIEKAVNQVVSFIEQNPGRFQNIKNESDYIQNRAGFKRGTADGNEWLIFPEFFRTEICRGYNTQTTIRELEAKGLLIVGNGDNKMRMETMPDIGRKRVYVIRLKDDGDGETDN